MKIIHRFIGLLALLPVASCTNLERSRDLGNPAVPAAVLAQQVCANCHGAGGNAISPNFPNLSGQTEPYLLEQLTEFRSHQRADPAGFQYMWGLVRHLSDQQIADLASYYANSRVSPNPAGRTADLLGPGHDLYTAGKPDAGIPACQTCHGDSAQGNGTFPRLAGQHADYLAKQLKVFQRGDERPDGGVMKVIAHGLNQSDIKVVTHYLQALRPEAAR